VTANVMVVCVPQESSSHASCGPPQVPMPAESTVSKEAPPQVVNVTVPDVGAVHW
jgi:hypothetical protein